VAAVAVAQAQAAGTLWIGDALSTARRAPFAVAQADVAVVVGALGSQRHPASFGAGAAVVGRTVVVGRAGPVHVALIGTPDARIAAESAAAPALLAQAVVHPASDGDVVDAAEAVVVDAAAREGAHGAAIGSHTANRRQIATIVVRLTRLGAERARSRQPHDAEAQTRNAVFVHVARSPELSGALRRQGRRRLLFALACAEEQKQREHADALHAAPLSRTPRHVNVSAVADPRG
jgi:hypothetical protein